MANPDYTTSQVTKFIIEMVSLNKPETTNSLIKLVQQKYTFSEKEIITILLQLETENKIHFAKKLPTINVTSRPSVFSASLMWYWVTIAIAIMTAITVFTIPENAYPLIYVREILGTGFVLFLPGFVLLKTLYPFKTPIASPSANLETIESIALSIGLSIAFTAIVGMALNYTPWGVRIVPITLTLIAVTLIFATTAVAHSGNLFVFFKEPKTNGTCQQTDVPLNVPNPTQLTTLPQSALQKPISQQTAEQVNIVGDAEKRKQLLETILKSERELGL